MIFIEQLLKIQYFIQSQQDMQIFIHHYLGSVAIFVTCL